MYIHRKNCDNIKRFCMEQRLLVIHVQLHLFKSLSVFCLASAFAKLVIFPMAIYRGNRKFAVR